MKPSCTAAWAQGRRFSLVLPFNSCVLWFPEVCPAGESQTVGFLGLSCDSGHLQKEQQGRELRTALSCLEQEILTGLFWWMTMGASFVREPGPPDQEQGVRYPAQGGTSARPCEGKLTTLCPQTQHKGPHRSLLSF